MSIKPEELTLRDYFAAQALAGDCGQNDVDNICQKYFYRPEHVAERAYAIADAMLKERKKK